MTFEQSIFYDGLLVLNKYSLTWLVDRFFFETLGITYDSIAKTIRERWTSTAPLPMKAIEHGLYKARSITHTICRSTQFLSTINS